jgi:hypothetical protein
VQGEFVEDDMPALSREGVGIGGETVDTQTAGELEHIRGEFVLFIEDHLAQISSSQLQNLCPVFAIIQKELCLRVIARRNPHIQPRSFCRHATHRRISRAIGKADLPRLLDNLQRTPVLDRKSTRWYGRKYLSAFSLCALLWPFGMKRHVIIQAGTGGL